MQILRLNFFLQTIAGLWRPMAWCSKRSKLLYGLFTFFSIYSISFLMVTQLLKIIFIIDNVEEYASNCLIFISVISVWIKALGTVIRRDQIINVIRILEEKPCKACNKEETDIQIKFDHLIRSYSIRYILMCTVSVTGTLVGGLLDVLENKLPYNVWVPYDYSSMLSYWLTYAQETVAYILATIINVAAETSVLGFCLQMCAQFEILEHRLQSINPTQHTSKCFLADTPNKPGRLSEHICHHLCIIRLTELINDIFREILFVQFFVSILVLCLCLYHLTFRKTIADVATMIVYIFCMFLQIFIYCWAGNEVMLQSIKLSENIYQMDWTLMTISERKDLLMIMKRCTRPIKLTSSFLVTLSLDSYGKLLKASYSAFNVLQQS